MGELPFVPTRKNYSSEKTSKKSLDSPPGAGFILLFRGVK
jgi:hypothetical protein